ncbi:DUF3857 domain-containing protein [Xanthomarina spongicola]|uniref:Transglutaminase-like putative cysteine protease n=1 Tax=Xanthomarina spongicola TaxID=570520 RepID=A0A316EDJ8_9FLAO|nr:DUF3857 domain-containing protein [Xanthomarina spongicola]PWK21030.1 transglutaminase-like putative cysteine protease [Xanthomarina spongicola]
MKFFFLFACVFTLQIATAQDYKFGKISKEELQEKSDPTDPEANATVLYRNQEIKFEYIESKGFVQKNEIHERIKIYNKEGFEQATKSIKLYNESNELEESLTGFKAYTYNLNGNKITEDKLKNDGIFEEETNRYWLTTKFTMPNIKEGCIIEYKYTIESELIRIDDIEFQQEIPIRRLEFKMSTPEFYNYAKYPNVRSAYYPQLNDTYKETTVFLSGEMQTKISHTPTRGTRSDFSKNEWNYRENITTANLVNIPALKNETHVSNIDNYRAIMKMDLSYIKYPDQPRKDFTTNWEKVTKTIYDSNDFGEQLKKSGYFGDDLNSAKAGATDPAEQAYNIFNFVKNKVKWNGIHGYFTDLGVRQAYKQGAGNVADINLILIAMLRESGLDANPVLISTKDNGVPLFPTRGGFNYVICAVNLEQGMVLLDASKSFTSLNVLPVKVLNWQGRLIRRDGSSDWVDLSVQEPSKEVISLNIKLNSDLSATGKVRSQYTDYSALDYRNTFESHSQDDLIKEIESENGNLQVSNIEVADMNIPIKPVLLSYEYQLDEALEEIGDSYYFSPLLFLKIEESPFKLQTRKYPIDLDFPTSRKYMVNIMLPEGFQVESLPENEKLQYNNTEGEFTYLIRENGTMLQMVITLDLNNTLILPTNYEQFKKFFELVVSKQAEKIVLKKV